MNPCFPEVKTAETVGPVLIHVITNKGQGYIPAESAQVSMVLKVRASGDTIKVSLLLLPF